jgi:hypothetical protein
MEEIELDAEERERAFWRAENAAGEDETTVDLTAALGSIDVVIVFERWDVLNVPPMSPPSCDCVGCTWLYRV